MLALFIALMDLSITILGFTLLMTEAKPGYEWGHNYSKSRKTVMDCSVIPESDFLQVIINPCWKGGFS